MNKKTELKTTTALVKAILEDDEKARNSDSYLYLQVIENIARHKGYDLRNIKVCYFLEHMKEYGFPIFESVRRARQKLQRKFPELSADAKVEEYRAENEEVFREYARS